MLTLRERRKQAARDEAAELIADYGIDSTARALDVHPLTVRRWASGEVTCPTPALIALRALVKAQLPGQEHRDWIGWRFGRDGVLYDPSGGRHGPGDIMAQRYERQLIRHLQGRVRALEAALEARERVIDTLAPAANDRRA